MPLSVCSAPPLGLILLYLTCLAELRVRVHGDSRLACLRLLATGGKGFQLIPGDCPLYTRAQGGYPGLSWPLLTPPGLLTQPLMSTVAAFVGRVWMGWGGQGLRVSLSSCSFLAHVGFRLGQLGCLNGKAQNSWGSSAPHPPRRLPSCPSVSLHVTVTRRVQVSVGFSRGWETHASSGSRGLYTCFCCYPEVCLSDPISSSSSVPWRPGLPWSSVWSVMHHARSARSPMGPALVTQRLSHAQACKREYAIEVG